MTSINEIAEGTGLSKSWLYEQGLNELNDTEKVERLAAIAADMKANGMQQLERAAKVRGYALVKSYELE